MSEQPIAEATATETEATTEQPTEQPKPTETVDYWKQRARENERRAKDNADAAKELATIRDAQKSEAEKAADRIKQAEADAAEARREALRFRVASKHGIDSETADLLLTGSDEESMERQAAAIKQQSDARRKQGNHVPNEGTSGTPAPNADAKFASELFAGG